MILDALLDALLDTAKLLPFLFTSYFFIEYVEHKASEKLVRGLYGLGRKGPFLGSFAGLLPMCGLSVSAADLYANRLISAGTLIAELAAESDEALPVLLSTPGFQGKALLLAAVTFVIGVLAGFGADWLFPRDADPAHAHLRHEQLHAHCEQEECEREGLFRTALLHTLKSAGFVFAAVAFLNLLVAAVGEDAVASFFSGSDLVEPLFAALIGLVPNCAPSIVLSEFYVSGLIGFGSLVSGLTMNAGVGLAVLWRQNRSAKQNLALTAYLFLVALLAGYVLQLLRL